MLKRITMFAATATLLLASTLSHADGAEAQEVVEDTLNKMLDVYQENPDRFKSDPKFLRSEVQELIVPHIDFETMTKLAISKFWRQADKNQHEVLVTEFTTLLLNTYTAAIAQYSGKKVDRDQIVFEPFRPSDREDRAEVKSKFVQPQGDDLTAVYKLRDKGGEWLIYDIVVNDISLVTSYRSAFSSEIEKGGIDGLIKTLKERNAKS